MCAALRLRCMSARTLSFALLNPAWIDGRLDLKSNYRVFAAAAYKHILPTKLVDIVVGRGF